MNKGKSDDDKGSDSFIVFDGKEPNRAFLISSVSVQGCWQPPTRATRAKLSFIADP